MIGGHFDYRQYVINDIADEIERIIDDNDIKTKYSPYTISRMKQGIQALRLASVYAQRIDWLRSGDDGEDSFHKRLTEEMDEFYL